jgi:hypothetical protein
MNTKPLNDSLDNLFTGDTGEVRTAPVVDRPAAAEYAKLKEEGYFEKCTKCSGTGEFRGWSGRSFGTCFACKGKGGQTFKTPRAVRVANRSKVEERKEKKANEAWAAFVAQQPAVAAWIEAKRGSFEFAAKMRDAVVRFGDLTEGQLAACQRCVDKDVARAAERAAREASAPAVDNSGVDRLKQAFDKARAYAAAKGPNVKIRNPKITIGGMTISPAKADSANAGALYVKQSGQYLGKIMNGHFRAVRECTPAQEKQVLAFVADPASAAKAYGQETGICCVCNAELKSEWRLRGIGPICAKKMGWVDLAKDFGADVE